MSNDSILSCLPFFYCSFILTLVQRAHHPEVWLPQGIVNSVVYPPTLGYSAHPSSFFIPPFSPHQDIRIIILPTPVHHPSTRTRHLSSKRSIRRIVSYSTRILPFSSSNTNFSRFLAFFHLLTFHRQSHPSIRQTHNVSLVYGILSLEATSTIPFRSQSL